MAQFVDEKMTNIQKYVVDILNNGTVMDSIINDWKSLNDNNRSLSPDEHLLCNSRFAWFAHETLEKRIHWFMYSVTVAEVLSTSIPNDVFPPKVSSDVHYVTFTHNDTFILITFIRPSNCSTVCLPKHYLTLETCENHDFANSRVFYALLKNKRFCGASYIENYYMYKVCDYETFAVAVSGQQICN